MTLYIFHKCWPKGINNLPKHLEFTFRVNPRNWALPLSIGGGIWEDEEVGDYGTVYSVEECGAIIVSCLCFSLRVDWIKNWTE